MSREGNGRQVVKLFLISNVGITNQKKPEPISRTGGFGFALQLS